jgi:glycosyltransferase involved in cell wall biosynthesis
MSISEGIVVIKGIGRSPRVSVVMPTYNVRGYIGEAIKSILTQTYNDYEFIIVDDGSSDGTAEIIKGFNDPRMRFFQRSHLGTVYQLNFGLAQAEGQFIARQDSDDYSHPERLEKQVDFLETHPQYGVVSSAMQLIDVRGKSLGILRYPREPDFEKLMVKCCISHPASMWRSEIHEKLGGYDELFNKNCCEDYDFWLRVVECFRICIMDEVLYTKREHARSSIQLNRSTLVPIYDEMARKRAVKRRQIGMLPKPENAEGALSIFQ